MRIDDWRLLPITELYKKPHLSISSAKTYTACPHSYKLQSIDRVGRTQPTSTPMEIGSVTHAVLDYCNDHRVRFKYYPTLENILFVSRKYIEASVVFTPAEKSKLVTEVVNMVLTYLQTIASLVEPVLYEEKFLIERTHDELRLHGIIDLTEDVALWDYKVTGKPVEAAILHSDQLHCYALAFRLFAGHWPERIGIINLVRRGKVTQLAIPVDHKNVVRTLDTLGKVWESIKAARFEPRTGLHCRNCNFAAPPVVAAQVTPVAVQKPHCQVGAEFLQSNPSLTPTH